MTRKLHVLFLVALVMVIPAQAAEPKIPIIHSTDLCHPYDDPDDHFDLACLFAMREFDIRGIVLDLGEHQASRPGRPAVEQILHISGRKVPYVVGLSKPLRSRKDKATEEAEQFQGGIQLILSLLRDSHERVLIHTAGSCRDVAAAFNREPELFRAKVKAIYIEAGNGPSGTQDEYNVSICPLSFLRLLESGLPVCWCPCFGKDGYQTFYQADQARVVGACTQPVQNFFVYCLSKSKEDPLSFLSAGPKPLPVGPRNMWCTAPMFHAAGRKVYQRGSDDFVALTLREAEKAGLSSKAVDVFHFLPVRVGVESLPAPDTMETKPAPPRLSAQWDSPQATTCVFRSTDPRYEQILASCLKNLLAELGR
ncbi:MAG: hypothetical protein ACLP9L_16900 [Thermoguttaceae bacterium]